VNSNGAWPRGSVAARPPSQSGRTSRRCCPSCARRRTAVSLS